MSLNVEFTETKRPSFTAGTKDLHQTNNLSAASSHSVCPLCFGTFSHMLYLHPCLHSFCFSCTQTLLETDEECPCCKQPFTSIFHPVRTKRSPKKLPLKKHSKKEPVSSLPTKKHPKEKHASLPPQHKNETTSLPVESHSEDQTTFCCGDHSFLKFEHQRLFSPSSLKLPTKVNPLLSGVTKHQTCHEHQHFPTLKKKADSEQMFTEKVDNKTALNSSPESRDDDPNNHQHRVKSANLSKPNFLEAIWLLISSGTMIFICFYIFLILVLPPKS